MPDLSRRQALLGLAGALAGIDDMRAAAQPRQSDLIRHENQHDATTDWQLTYTRVDPKTRWRSPRIEGYVSKQSVRAGNALDIFVSTNPEGERRVQRLDDLGAQGLSSPPGHMLPYSHFGRPHGPDQRVQRMTRNLFERFLK